MDLLFYDTETTGLPQFSEPSSSPQQPHIVQIAGSLVDSETRRVRASLDLVVRPDGWKIDPETTAIHGITDDYALQYGVDELMAVDLLCQLWKVAHLRVGHVESFDARIIRIAQKRYGFAEPLMARWKEGRSECTAALAKTASGSPAAKPRKGKSATAGTRMTLSDAHLRFVGAPLEGAHTARGDVDGCIAVYFALKGGHRRGR